MDVTQKLMLRVVSNSKAENILITATKSKMQSWKKKIARIEGSYELKIWWVKYGLSLTSPLGIADWTSGARDAAVKFTCETFVAWAFVCREKIPTFYPKTQATCCRRDTYRLASRKHFEELVHILQSCGFIKGNSYLNKHKGSNCSKWLKNVFQLTYYCLSIKLHTVFESTILRFISLL